MDFNEAVKGLRSEEIEALKVLEASGWQIGLDVRVEDMTKPDGQRRRTFSNRGRYAVAVILKNLGGRDRVEFPAFTPDLNQGIEAAAFVQAVEVVEPMAGEISIGETVEEITEAPAVESVEIKFFDVEKTEVLTVPEPEPEPEHKRSHHKKPEIKTGKKHK